MRRTCALLLLLVIVGYAQVATPQVSVGVSIGINIPVFPELVVVPSYPVYYAPAVTANYFFYDGLFWVFNVEDGQWYSSSWYNGPWVFVEPMFVPQPVLVVPFRYYRVRPVYWSGWGYDAPPRWGDHWGREWESRRAGWDRWDRSRMPTAAPLPLYQRDYPRDRYPAPTQQVIIHNERYTYRVQDTHVQQQRAEIVRRQSSGGTKAAEKAERVQQASPGGPGRERPPRQETTQPSASPRPDGSAVERGRPERGRPERRGPEPQRVDPQPDAPREQVAPSQVPRGDRPHPRQQRPGEERQQPERGPEGNPGEGPGQGRR